MAPLGHRTTREWAMPQELGLASGAGEQAAKVISQSFVLQVSEPCGTGGPEAFTEVAAANVDLG